LFVSVCANALLIAILVAWYVGYEDYQRAALAASHAELSAALHGGILNLQNFKENQQKSPEIFIRELKAAEAAIFLVRVNGLAWLDEQNDNNDESLVRLKEKLKVARSFIAANPDLFSTNSNIK